ncbi:MAG: hypothetical protein HC774_02010 [Sphingomonadales bacterium]|nr:hypothetical protein [Sphingomonadales bacterium]
MWRPALLAALVALASGLHAQDQTAPAVELTVAGPPISAEATGQAFLYRTPPSESAADRGGASSQQWSMLGREDKAALIDNEYGTAFCPQLNPSASGESAVLARIVAEARAHRVVIINESHVVSRHRDFSREVMAALRPLGYSVLAAETFANTHEPNQDPVDVDTGLPFVHQSLGYYSREPVFAALLREAKSLGYRFAAYEQVYDPDRVRPASNGDWRIDIRDRETEQAQNLAAILSAMSPAEKLIVHVGYSHARETVVIEKDGWEDAWMAARLKRITGIDPLTIDQTYCHGSSDTVRLAPPSADKQGWFDLNVDHPVVQFRHGRPEWRFASGQLPIAIPESLRPTEGPLVIEAFAEGEADTAVPVDRIWIEPGEDLRLALPPGRYRVRAVRPAPSGD